MTGMGKGKTVITLPSASKMDQVGQLPITQSTLFKLTSAKETRWHSVAFQHVWKIEVSDYFHMDDEERVQSKPSCVQDF